MTKRKKKNKGVVTFKPPSHLPQGVSKEETELYNIIQLEFPKLKIERSNRLVLNGRELDMYIPSHKLAIEYDGVYFHSTAKKDDKFYHLWKTIECEKRGIRLIHVLSDEWELKRPLVIDMIRKALGKYQTIKENECNIYELSKKEEEVFLNNNHLLGYYPNSAMNLGLTYQNNVIMSVSFAVMENVHLITRIAYKKGILIDNGLNKIIKYYKDNYWDGDLYASIDRRFETAYDLKNAGFIEIEPSNPKTSYTKDFQHRYLERDFKKFNEAALLKNGWQKVYDCGRRRFLLKSENNSSYF